MGLRAAVDQHCKSCIYDSAASGGWRQQVKNCSVSKCSLWEYRTKGYINTVDKVSDSALFDVYGDNKGQPILPHMVLS